MLSGDRGHDEGIAFLTERIAAIEHERDSLLLKSQRLERLQRSFVEITAARDESTLAAAVLRGAWLGLGFGRALWFSIGASQELVAQFELDGESVAESEYGGTLPAGSALTRIARGDSDVATGSAQDVDAALFDTRRWYAAAAVRVRSGDSYALYADGASERSPSAWAVSALRELATQAAFALDNMRMSAELERLSLHDPLTALFNRRALMDCLARELATLRRSGEPLAFAMIDVDDFKKINDSLGHTGGDEALKRIAHTLRTHTRETDIPARFAGDEFSLVMPRTDAASCVPVMERLSAALRAAGTNCSIGIGFADRETTIEELIARADAAVYAAKAAGKNCFRLAPERP